MQDTLDAGETVVGGEQHRVIETADAYRVEGVDGIEYESEREARIAGKLMDETGHCPALYPHNATHHVPRDVATARRETLAGWFYNSYTPMPGESDYVGVSTYLDVSLQTARNYVTGFLDES